MRRARANYPAAGKAAMTLWPVIERYWPADPRHERQTVFTYVVRLLQKG